MTLDEVLHQIGEIGEDLAADYNDGLDGKFGWTVTTEGDEDYPHTTYLNVKWEPALPAPEPGERRASDYGPAERYRFKLVPVTAA